MKKFKIGLMLCALFIGTCLISGCANSSESKDDKKNQEEKTVASVLTDQFKEEIKKDKNLENVAKALAENEILKIELDVATIGKNDYISGFKSEIKEFKNAVVLRPFIGTIPFIAYIFEVENPESFAENLKTNADLRWNVCTEAEDLEVTNVDNYVFIVMSPKNFDEE